MWQKAYRDQRFVTQAIRIALTRFSQCNYASRDCLPNAVWAPIVKFRESAIIGRVQYRARGNVKTRVGIHGWKELVIGHSTPPSAARQERSDPSPDAVPDDILRQLSGIYQLLVRPLWISNVRAIRPSKMA
jgi:hypothetical protein